MAKLKQIVAQAGGVTAVAKAVGVSPQVVSNWIKRGQVSALFVVPFEAVTGASRHELRPDVFGRAPEKAA